MKRNPNEQNFALGRPHRKRCALSSVFTVLLLMTMIFVGPPAKGAGPDDTVSVIVAVELIGPDDTYPVQDAVVTLAGDRHTTDASGRVLFENVPKGQRHTVRIATGFAATTETARIDGDTIWSVPVPLPETVTDSQFHEAIFWNGADHYRWERDDTVRVFFDYTGGQNFTPAERAAAEAVALEAFQGWFRATDGHKPYLKWGGSVANADEANVTVHMMHDDAYYAEFPEAAGTRNAGRGGGRYLRPGDYMSGGEIWIRIDCCALSSSLYAHELGHVFGFTHTEPDEPTASIMTPASALPGVTPTDLDMMKVKMHLPPQLPYNRDAPPRSDTRWHQISYGAGTVVDEFGDPLPGVTVATTDGRKTTITDRRGRWTIGGLTDAVTVSAHTERWTFSPARQHVPPTEKPVSFTGRRVGASVPFFVFVTGPDGAHPVKNALLQIGQERARTGDDGRAVVHHLSPDVTHPVVVTTHFGEFFLGIFAVPRPFDGQRVTNLELPVPVSQREFNDGILAGAARNIRWQRGAPISVFFDYEHAGHVAPDARNTAEQLVLDVFREWIGPATGTDPHLLWRGKAARREDAAIVINMMDDAAFFNHNPDASPNIVYRIERAQSWVDGTYYLSAGELFLRVECCGHVPSLYEKALYARAAGRLLGLGPLPAAETPRSVMEGDLDTPTDIDRLMLRLKMQLPPGEGSPR